MSDILIKFLETIANVPTALLVALLIVVSVTLFSPDSVAQILALDGFRIAHRNVLGPMWLLLASIIGAKVILYFSKVVARRNAMLARRRQLRELTPQEKGYLSSFIIQKENTIYVDMTDGVAGGLRRKGILYSATSNFDLLMGVPCNLQPWARKYLIEHPELLEGAIGKPRTPHEHRGLGW